MNRRRRSTAALLFATAVLISLPAIRAQERPYALSGTLVTPTGIVDDGIVLIAAGRIRELGAGISLPPGTPLIRTGGVIFPGLIDLHNHVTWNVFPRWSPGPPTGDRYDWQAMPDYKAKLFGPEATMISRGDGCDMERFGEVKALLGGATSIVGTYAPSSADPHRNACDRGLARNLDFFSGLYSQDLNAEPLDNEIYPFEVPFARAQSLRDAMDSGKITALLAHVAEGKDASAAEEFKILKADGLLRRGVSIIHGVGLDSSDFGEMARDGVGLIWSPHSDITLYGVTANVRAAKAAGVTIAIGPDWSPTGSNGMSEELHYAYEWNARLQASIFSPADFIAMATSNSAKLAAVSGKIGALVPGEAADLAVYPRSPESPLLALLNARPASIMLVIVGGKPMLGDPALMKQLVPVSQLQPLTVCNQAKSLNTEDLGGETWPGIVNHLTDELKAFNLSLAPLADCSTVVE